MMDSIIKLLKVVSGLIRRLKRNDSPLIKLASR